MAFIYVMYHATCARKVMHAVCEKQAPISFRSIARAELTTPEYRMLNPAGVVPTLVFDDGTTLTESSLIMRYIDEVHAGPALQPSHPIGRAAVDLWLKHVDEIWFSAMSAITVATYLRQMFGDPIDEKKLQIMLAGMTDPVGRLMRESVIRQGLASPWINAAVENVSAMLRSMEAALKTRDWLADDTVTLAESAVMPLILRLEEFGLDALWQRRLPRVADWWSRLKERPATVQVMALTDPAERELIVTASQPWRAPLLELLCQA